MNKYLFDSFFDLKKINDLIDIISMEDFLKILANEEINLLKPEHLKGMSLEVRFQLFNSFHFIIDDYTFRNLHKQVSFFGIISRNRAIFEIIILEGLFIRSYY